MSQSFPQQFRAALTWAAIALLTYLLYLIVEPFLIPLGWGCVLAVLIYPAFGKLALRIGAGRAAAAATLVTAIVLIAPGIALTNAFSREMIGISQTLQDMFADGGTSGVDRAWAQLIERVPAAARVDIGAVGADALQQTATFLMRSRLHPRQLRRLLPRSRARPLRHLLPASRRRRDHARGQAPAADVAGRRETFITRTGDLIAAGVTSSVIVASLQGLLGGLAFAVLGLSAPVFWGVVMAFACLLPFGAGIVWLPAAIFLALSAR